MKDMLHLLHVEHSQLEYQTNRTYFAKAAIAVSCKEQSNNYYKASKQLCKKSHISLSCFSNNKTMPDEWFQRVFPALQQFSCALYRAYKLRCAICRAYIGEAFGTAPPAKHLSRSSLGSSTYPTCFAIWKRNTWFLIKQLQVKSKFIFSIRSDFAVRLVK